MEHKKVDFLVIGSGIAGLSFALKVAPFGKVCVITKSSLEESNTAYAQGGIAAVVSESDDFEKHIADTLKCGWGLCNEEVVRMVVQQAPECISELVNWGTQFDRNQEGNFDLGREGGHSEHRVLHHKDSTGAEIVRALVEQIRNHPNIEVLEHHFAVEIITQHHLGQKVTRHIPGIECYGAYVLDVKNSRVETFLSKITCMSTGGAGMVYSTTTNPVIATGDGLAMVHRAKGILENLEFVQFHPTSLYNPLERPSFLITEAVRGFGGILKTADGKEFMHKYDVRKSLAPRDIVARAIDNQMKISGDDHVFLDCTHLDSEALINHFPNIYQKCLSIGIDITRQMIPVVPAAHYMCGGIKVDYSGATTIGNLFAVGECASTGMHGANRLASNSLLEAAVFASRAAEKALELLPQAQFSNKVPAWNAEGTVLNEEMVLITQSLKEVQGIMSNYVGIVRSNLRLKRAFDRLELLYRETEDLYIKSVLSPKLCELRNVISVAYLIIKMAMKRKESMGLHYSIDYPLNKN